MRLFKTAELLAAMLIVAGCGVLEIARPGHAQSCDRQCQQAADQEALLAPFNNLLSTAEGRALLDANLAKENEIYLNATQADRVASGTILILSAVPANVLIRAFPGNPAYGYDAQGLPTIAKLPGAIDAMEAAIISSNQIVPMKSFFGATDIYGRAYGYLPGQSDSVGNPPPYQVSAAIFNHPFTPQNSSYLAWQNQQTPGAYGINWISGDSKVGDYPSAHTILATSSAIPFAILAPGYYQQFAFSLVNFSYDLNVFAVHYPLDVIAGRISATYVIANMLAGAPLYTSSVFNTAMLPTLSAAMQNYLGGGGSSPYAAACANLVACLNAGVIPTTATYQQQARDYLQFMTYGLPSVGHTDLAPVVPAEAHYLIATRYPYLSTDQLNEILYTTETASGVPLDNGSGWARINLFAAAGGYGAFRSNVSVTMDASRGGLNAFDVWSNDISGPGGLTLAGTGTLVLAGANTYTGGTQVLSGATLGLSGSMFGPLSVASGASFVVGRSGVFTGALNNDVSVTNSGVVNGSFSGAGTFNNAGVLMGSGSLGSLNLLAGSVTAPGHSVGTIQVAGDLSVARGATYFTEVQGGGADLIQVGGRANLAGGNVVAGLIGYAPVLGQAYPILTAAGGVVGSFTGAAMDDRPFLQPTLTGTANSVFLTLNRNAVPFASLATTPNQIAVANALDRGPAASGLGLLITSQTAAGGPRAFTALSGEVHASAQTVLVDDSLLLREALTGRMRQSQDAGGAAGATAFWGQGVGAWAHSDSDGNAAAIGRSVTGFFSGVDHRVAPGWLAGIAGGYTNATATISERGSSANIDTAHLAAYAAAESGPWRLRSAAAASLSTLATSRSVIFPGLSETAGARYDAATAQAFAEIGYGYKFGGVAAEPFGGLALVHLHRSAFTEGGGLSVLGAPSRDDDIGYSTLGLRVAKDIVHSNGAIWTPRLTAAWQHALSPVTMEAPLTLLATGVPFSVAGVPLARDTALLEAGLDVALGPRAKIGLLYSAQRGEATRRDQVRGQFSWQF